MTITPDTNRVTLLGANYSVYTRICLYALRLKGVAFEFEPLDIFAEGGPETARQAGQPFGKIPILRHGELTLCETLAITRYIDEVFEGPPLQPEDPAQRARMNQIVSIVDTQVYPVLVWGLHVPKSQSRDPEPGMIDRGSQILSVLEDFTGKTWLCGETPSLADFYLAACMDYVLDSAAVDLLPETALQLLAWWQRAQALLKFS